MTANDFATLEDLLCVLNETPEDTPAYREIYRRCVALMIPSKAKYVYNLLSRPMVAWIEGDADRTWWMVTQPWDSSEGGYYINAYDISNFHDDTEVLNAGASTSR